MGNCTVCGNKLVPGSSACLVCLGIADKSGNIDGGKGRVMDLDFGTLPSFRNRLKKNYANVSNETKARIDSWDGMNIDVVRTKKEKDRLRREGASIWRNIVNDLENNKTTLSSQDSIAPSNKLLPSEESNDKNLALSPEMKETVDEIVKNILNELNAKRNQLPDDEKSNEKQ